jgi:undecaprenyl-diphosphatase
VRDRGKEIVVTSKNAFVPAGLLVGMLFLGTVATAGYTADVDTSLLSLFALQQGPSPEWQIKAAQFVSWTGGGTQRYIIVAVLAVVLGWWRGWRTGAALALSSLLSSFASDIMKAAFARPRPSLVPHLDSVNNLSFPSGHATSAMAVYLFVALVVPPEQRARWMIPMMILAIATGISRMMLGVHFPSDVIGGWMLGAAFALVAVTVLRRLEGGR